MDKNQLNRAEVAQLAAALDVMDKMMYQAKEIAREQKSLSDLHYTLEDALRDFEANPDDDPLIEAVANSVREKGMCITSFYAGSFKRKGYGTLSIVFSTPDFKEIQIDIDCSKTADFEGTGLEGSIESIIINDKAIGDFNNFKEYFQDILYEELEYMVEYGDLNKESTKYFYDDNHTSMARKLISEFATPDAGLSMAVATGDQAAISKFLLDGVDPIPALSSLILVSTLALDTAKHLFKDGTDAQALFCHVARGCDGQSLDYTLRLIDYMLLNGFKITQEHLAELGGINETLLANLENTVLKGGIDKNICQRASDLDTLSL